MATDETGPTANIESLQAAAGCSQREEVDTSTETAKSEENPADCRARMLVVHVSRASLGMEPTGTCLQVRLACGICRSAGLWWNPLEARTDKVESTVPHSGARPWATFDTAFAFPWHDYFEPILEVSISRDSPALLGIFSKSVEVARARLLVPDVTDGQTHVGQPLQLARNELVRAGTLELSLEMRDVHRETLFDRFSSLVADTDVYIYEQCSMFPTIVEPLRDDAGHRQEEQAGTPGISTSCRGTKFAGSVEDRTRPRALEGERGVSPVLLGRPTLNTEQAHNHFNIAGSE